MAYLESGSVSAAPFIGQKASTAQDSIMKNVNLYRGAVISDIRLVSLDGLDGLDLTLAGCYGAKDEEFFKTNRLCNNGVLGFGMSMPLSAIITKNRGMKNTYQSDYYLSGQGGEFPLYRTGLRGDFVEFMSIEHPFWVFRRYDDKWDVIKDDGSVWTFGGTYDSLEVNVCWGNWTGPCNNAGGEEFAVGWYLSKVTSRYGNSIAFVYDNVKLPLGGCFYTSEMHLKEAFSAFGQRIKLNYRPKQSNEYDLMHNLESGVYQLLCERHYLDSLDVYSAEGSLLYSQILSYELVPAAEKEVKRLLVSVSQKPKGGELLPPLKLDWNTTGEYAGHISKLTYPREGALEFGYSKLESNTYVPDTFLSCSDDWNQSILNGSDFTAVLFTKDSLAKLKIVSWDMNWQIYEDEVLENRYIADASLFIGNGIAVVRYLSLKDNTYALRIIKRVPVRRYDWEGFDVTLPSALRPSIACGTDFVGIQYPDRNGILIYQFNYIDNMWHEFELPVDCMGRQTIGAGNNCIFGAYGYDNSRSVRVVTFYSDESHEWKIGNALDVPASVTWNYENSLPVWSINASLASACFIADNGDMVDATMIAIAWDKDFQIISNEILNVSQPRSSGNPTYYSITTDTMIGFANTALRYTPTGFMKTTLFPVSEDCEYTYAYGCDLFLGVEKQTNGTQRFRSSRFDAVLNAWTEDGAPYADSLSILYGICQPLVISDYAILGRSIYSRNSDDKWIIIGYLPNEADISSVRLGPDGSYLLYSIPQANLTRFVPMSPTRLGRSTDIIGGLTGGNSFYEAGSSCFFLSSVPGQPSGLSFQNMFRQNYYKASPPVTLLTYVTLDSGMDKQTVFLDYDMDSARLESDSFAAGVASVLPAANDGSFGRTIYSYYNGSAPPRVPYPTPDDYSNVADFYTHFAGQVNKCISYDGDGEKISEDRCYMKAFDSHGFCIQQTRIGKINYVKRFSLTQANSESIVDEIKTFIEYEYEPKYYRKRKERKLFFDKDGNKITVTKTIRYAFEDIKEMEDLNILGDIVKSTEINETENMTINAVRYDYDKNEAGYYYQTGEYTMGRTSGEWLTVSRVTEVDRHCRPLCSTNERAIPTSTLYDKNGLYPIAVTSDANTDEVLYCGFESYESTAGLTIDQKKVDEYITAGERFSGSYCLKLIAGKRLIAQNKVRNSELHLRFSAKSGASVRVKVDFGRGSITEKAFAPKEGWVVYSENFTASSIAEYATIMISGDKDVYIDAVYITPVLARGEAYVYSGDLKLQSATHKNYGPGKFTYFDRYDSPCVDVSDDGNFISFSNTIYHSGTTPNEMYTIKPSSYGVWYDGGQGYLPNPWFYPDKSGWSFTPSDHFALIFSLEGRIPNISYSNINLMGSNNEWILQKGSMVQKAAIPKGNWYYLIKMGNRCSFCGDGVVLFTFTSEGENPFLTMNNASDIRCIGYIPNPSISISCGDNSGRIVQDQIVTENGIRIVQTIYNELGVQTARTTQLMLMNAPWGYRGGYVTSYDKVTGKTGGEINAFFPEAEGFPCTAFKTSSSSKPEVNEMAQPGKAYAFGSGFTVKHASCSAGGFKSFLKDGFSAGDMITDADGMVTLNIQDGKGKVMSAKISENKKVSEITAYELDARGNQKKIYYPNYFSFYEDDSVKNDSEKFVSTIEYDSLGNIARRKDPDTDEVLCVYDHYGNLRFIQQDKSSGQYIYHLYDQYGRKTEIGYVQSPWNDSALRKIVDEDNERPIGGVPVRQYFYDEALDAAIPVNQIGQLTRLITTIDHKEVEERYEYDEYGRQIRYILMTAGRKEECITSYDTAGNVVERRTGVPSDGSLTYSYGVNKELNYIKFNQITIYECGYTSQGSLEHEIFGDNIRRDYTYNSANYLTSIDGTYFHQKIAYFDNNGVTNTSKKGGHISNVKTKYFFDRSNSYQQSGELCATYDDLGRVSSAAINDQETFRYLYDANGNQVKTGMVYQPGKNRLDTVDGAKVDYEGYGAMKAVSNRFELMYEPVTQMVKSMKTEHSSIHYTIGSGICGYDTGKGMSLSVESEDGKLFFESTQDGKVTLLVHGANGAFAQIVDGKVYYLIRDYRSSICGIADNKELLAAYDYDLFGNIIGLWESELLPTDLIPLRFAGARYEQTGLYRFKLRFYDPLLGRFLSPDTEAQYPNPYIYGGCDWINYFDPDGAFNIGGFFASLVVGVVLITVGVAITVATAGLGGGVGVALSILAAGIIGAGIASTIYSITSAINDDFSWSSWGIQMGAGAVFGMVSAGIGAAMPASMGVAASMLYDAASGMIVGAADGVVTNGLLNINNGKAFLDNVTSNALIGACFGGVLGAATGMSTAARNAKSMVRNNGGAGEQIGYVNWTNGSGCGSHSGIGVRTGTVGAPDTFSHLGYGDVINDVRHAKIYTGNPSLGNSTQQWVNVTADVAQRARNKMLPINDYGRYNKIFNNCTSYVIRTSSEAGIYQPLWARTPVTLNCWAWLTRAFQH